MTSSKTIIKNKAIESVTSDIYKYLKDKTSIKVKSWNAKNKIHLLFTQVNKVRMVKTLWQLDKAVDLFSFYCDSHIILDNKRKKIQKISDLPLDFPLIINGIAGQGKSIFLRYLCTTELLQGEHLPIFIELRKIQEDEELLDHILRYFEVLKIKIDNEVFENLVNQGLIILFLDGFDEVNEKIKNKLINQIEFLALKLESLKIIITSRPEGGLESSPAFRVVKLDNLQSNEFKNVIYKLSENTKFADNLIKQVENHKANLKELLLTPLLVTLLVMSYKSYQELPDQMSDFFDSIFQLLLQRHDGVKPGFKRPRRCKINDSQYRTIFEELCFESLKMSKTMYTYSEMNKIAETLLKKNEINENPDNYIDDIVKVTCLLLKEGTEYRFIHKSLQEYYTASLIKNKPDSVSINFYNYFVENGPWGKWGQVLEFLKEIDTYRYNKFFVIPYCLKILNFTIDTIPTFLPTITEEQTKQYLGEVEIGYDFKINLIRVIKWSLPFRYDKLSFPDFITADFGLLSDIILKEKITPFKTENDYHTTRSSPTTQIQWFKLNQLFEKNFLIEEAINYTNKEFTLVFNRLKAARKYIDKINSFNFDLQ